MSIYSKGNRQTPSNASEAPPDRRANQDQWLEPDPVVGEAATSRRYARRAAAGRDPGNLARRCAGRVLAKSERNGNSRAGSKRVLPKRVLLCACVPVTCLLGVAASVAPAAAPVLSESPAAVQSTAGSAVPGSTSYPIPSGAVFVSPAGNNSAAGAAASPLRTVAQAIARARSGSTIVLRTGTYHESIRIPSNKALTVQSYPGEAVWFDGSSAVTGWAKSGTTWVHSGWTAAFSQGSNSSFINPAYPMAGHPDQVWTGGVAQAQVGSAGAVSAGKFYVNYTSHQLVVGSNPSAQVRASDIADGIFVNSAYTTLRGFGVRNYATPTPDLATVVLAGQADAAENLVVSGNATVGVGVFSSRIGIRHVTVQDNGMLGMVANYADGLVVSSLLSQRNNVQQFNTAPVAGGTKITRSRGVVVKDSTFTANLGTGLWVDESSYNVTITGNHIYNNQKHGFSWEIGATGVIANNVVTGNARYGLKINDVTHVKIWNNTISGNGTDVILIQDGRRASNVSWPGHDPRQKLPDPTVTWLLGDIDVMNNILGAPAAGTYEVYADDASGQRSAAQMDLVVDANLFTPVSSGAEVVWGRAGGNPQVFKTIAQFKAGTGSGGANGETPAATLPRALPADVAAAIGHAAGTKHLGAF
jgi:trimeric autotransporter adhesin